MIPIDFAIQTYSRDTLVHLSRGMPESMLPFFGRLRRKDWVTSQFETGQQAREYAEADVQTRLDIGFRVFPGLLAGLELRGRPVLAP